MIIIIIFLIFLILISNIFIVKLLKSDKEKTEQINELKEKLEINETEIEIDEKDLKAYETDILKDSKSFSDETNFKKINANTSILSKVSLSEIMLKLKKLNNNKNINDDNNYMNNYTSEDYLKSKKRILKEHKKEFDNIEFIKEED